MGDAVCDALMDGEGEAVRDTGVCELDAVPDALDVSELELVSDGVPDADGVPV